jgi:hypothetical protein
VFCESREDAETVVGILRDWLAVGVDLSEEKTRIVHLTDGFDFLGFNVRRYRNPAPKRVHAAYQAERRVGQEAAGAVARGMAHPGGP